MFDMDEFMQSSTRVFTVSRKPGVSEYKTMAKITGLGIILIGIIAFFVKLILEGFVKI
ncbi:MAG TPA: protein translocase SEC61 complex subunit gamma [Candidatus Diapherotrites archaeon]|uniref:Protein translocase SEC61 complex subunit gamma n=1 Tax=Candidatus Iainarchaeum sp. TaxID=3101447 RepID=A0A7J4J0V6_9ARCH|nr:protein translocase SEC61 complex subunit gamma [Candidatus Diapherotrites archaeon]